MDVAPWSVGRRNPLLHPYELPRSTDDPWVSDDTLSTVQSPSGASPKMSR